MEWLERLEDQAPMTMEEKTYIEEFISYLEREHGIVANKQIDALWDILETEMETLAPLGVRPLLIDYPWGRELRFGIMGRRGLFSLATVFRLFGL